MSSNHFLKRIALAAIATLAASALHATPVPGFQTFYGEDLLPSFMVPSTGYAFGARTAFESNLTGIRTETFENRVVGSTAPLRIFDDSASITEEVDLELGEAPIGVVKDASPFGRFNTTGATGAANDGQWWETAGAFTIEFDSPISAFGFYGTDFGDFGGKVSVTLTGDVVTRSLTINTSINCTTGLESCNDADNGALIFWGFYDTGNTYKSITFGNTNPSVDFFGFDDMEVGEIKQVPEPATLALAGLGLIGLAATRRKQRH